ncbi:MAG: phosphate/phosphite/phosphonate ABC transporter substrate-binding protein [Gammaproteobacteria bacterium]|nr:phosphate/phosphite/phosphonate ABC transporter substrate-binding protein [Gammaproteobacteria bacterium]
MLAAVAFAVFAQPAAAETYKFGVVPQQAAKLLARAWGPVFRYLSARTGDQYVFATAPNIPEFEKRLAAGEYAVAYMNPYHYTVFGERPGYVALAKAKLKKIRGIVIVRKDSGITDIAQLDGTTLAFPAPAAFAASVLPRSEFTKAGVGFTPKYVSSHDSVYRSVYKGFYPAGGGVVRTFNNLDSRVRDELRILWKTDGYTPHAIATHPDVAPDVRSRLLSELEKMDGNDAGKALLERLKVKGFEHAAHADWDDVRALNIDLIKRVAKAETKL